jgi:hypothetical protein
MHVEILLLGLRNRGKKCLLPACAKTGKALIAATFGLIAEWRPLA